jgi:hypothetical protein
VDDDIRALLDVLEAAELAGASLNDTCLRESLQEVIHFGFVEQKPGYQVRSDLLLYYTPAAERQNAAVVRALEIFLQAARQWAAAEGLTTPDERSEAFFNSEVSSTSEEVNVDSYFE